MSKQVVYRRVSTVHQETERQFHNANIVFDLEFEDKLSGKNTNRPQLKACLASLEKGDTLHVWEVSRLSRNLTDLRETVLGLIDKGVSVKFHKEGLDFSADGDGGMKSAMSRMQLNLMGTIAEFERDLIRNRVKEGLAVAKANGKKLGGSSPKRKLSQEREYVALRERDEKYRGIIESGRKNGLTYRELAVRMNELGIKSPKGVELTHTTVARMATKLGII